MTIYLCQLHKAASQAVILHHGFVPNENNHDGLLGQKMLKLDEQK